LHRSRDIAHAQWRFALVSQALRSRISQKQLEIHTWSQWSTYRKRLLGNPLVTWQMTSHDPKRSRSWPRHRQMQISRKRWEIRPQYQLTTNMKCYMGNRMDMCPMTSRDVETSRSWHNYVWGPISRKRLEIHTWSQWSTYRKCYWGIHWLHDWWRHVTLKGQGRSSGIGKCKYIENGER